jgi:hypothetical protein
MSEPSASLSNANFLEQHYKALADLDPQLLPIIWSHYTRSNSSAKQHTTHSSNNIQPGTESSDAANNASNTIVSASVRRLSVIEQRAAELFDRV